MTYQKPDGTIELKDLDGKIWYRINDSEWLRVSSPILIRTLAEKARTALQFAETMALGD